MFVVAQQARRELTRTRKELGAPGVHSADQQLLERANVKLGLVLMEVLRPSERAIVAGLVAGETDAERLVDRTCSLCPV